jgi:hypothetical protein
MNFWQTILVALISGGITGGFINYFFDRRLQKESLQRIQAAKVAEFFAKWAKYSGKETSVLERKELYDYYENLTRMSYELSLWIEDEELVKEIMKRFTNSEDALSTKQLVIKARALILNKKTKSLTADNLVHWWVKDDQNDAEPHTSS